MESNLSGKTVLITEAARNFGPPTSLAFAAEGANLVLATGDPTDDLAATLQSASTAGVRVKSFHWDVADASQVDLVVRDAVAEFGRIDVVVNNSAVANSAQSFETISFSEWERKLGVEITGTTLVCKAVLPGMIERRWGRIINYIGLSAFLGSNAPDSASNWEWWVWPGVLLATTANTTSPPTALGPVVSNRRKNWGCSLFRPAMVTLFPAGVRPGNWRSLPCA